VAKLKNFCSINIKWFTTVAFGDVVEFEKLLPGAAAQLKY
jgi:hypothetical protein